MSVPAAMVTPAAMAIWKLSTWRFARTGIARIIGIVLNSSQRSMISVITRSVGTSTMPPSAMSRAAASSRSQPCSIVSTPARMAICDALRIEAWQATRRSQRCASSTIAPSSAGVNSTTLSGPLIVTLMQSAPARTCSRTARRQSSGPSASRAIPGRAGGSEPWPPVMQMIWPHGTTREPGMSPRCTASRVAIATPFAVPTSRTVVMPAARVALTLRAARNAPSAMVSRAGRAPKPRWTWRSISPGRRTQPARSTVRASPLSRMEPSATMSAMRPSSMTTARPLRGGGPVPSNTRAPRRIVRLIGRPPPSMRALARAPRPRAMRSPTADAATAASPRSERDDSHVALSSRREQR
jgi:hypothetical protein